jgi:hypothetical protein
MARGRWLAVVMVVSLGCSGGEKPRVPVAGRVTYRGCPVRAGVIAFTPDAERGHTGPAGRADLATDGSFRLPDGGLSPGWYRVTIASLEYRLPARYQDPEMSNLPREVIPGRDNSFDIILDD